LAVLQHNHAGAVVQEALAVTPTTFAGPVLIENLDALATAFAGPIQDGILDAPPPYFGAPTGGPQTLLAATQTYSGPTSGQASIPPPRGFGGTTEGAFPPAPGGSFSGTTAGSAAIPPNQTFSGPTEGRAVVTVRGYSGPTAGRSSNIPPVRGFGAATGGVVAGIPQPENLTATVVDAGCIRLDWVDPSDEETGYRLERSLENANDWETIADLPEDAETFLDRFAVPLTVYDYRVIGFNEVRESVPSNIATAVTPLPPDISTGPPPSAPVDPPRNQIEPDVVEFKSPGSYGLEKDEDGNVTGFKF